MRLIHLNVHSPKLLLVAFVGMTTILPILPTSAQTPLPQAAPQTDQPTPTARRFEGEVEKYLLNREGIVDGLLLNNGVQAKLPPQLSKNLIETVEVGDSVIVIGSGGILNPLGQEVQAESVTNRDTNRTVSTTVNYSNLSVEGTAQRWLIGKQGEIRGVLLSDGAQVQFPPRFGSQLSPMAKPGARIQAQGVGIRNDYGQVLEASTLTIDGQAIDLPTSPKEPNEKRRDRATDKSTLTDPGATRVVPRPAPPLN
jgi:hypothetical protein